MIIGCVLFFFFFQAEDGIRDIGVTGVQTCALPILDAGRDVPRAAHAGGRPGARRAARALRRPAVALLRDDAAARRHRAEIGRASCRERGVDLGGRRIIKKKKYKLATYVSSPVRSP